MRLYKFDRGAKPLHINHTLQGVRGPSIHGHRHIGGNKRKGVEAVLRVLHLPNPPDAVQRSVVEVEDRIAGGSVGISARVDGGDVVACSVDLIPKRQLQPFFCPE